LGGLARSRAVGRDGLPQGGRGHPPRAALLAWLLGLVALPAIGPALPSTDDQVVAPVPAANDELPAQRLVVLIAHPPQGPPAGLEDAAAASSFSQLPAGALRAPGPTVVCVIAYVYDGAHVQIRGYVGTSDPINRYDPSGLDWVVFASLGDNELDPFIFKTEEDARRLARLLRRGGIDVDEVFEIDDILAQRLTPPRNAGEITRELFQHPDFLPLAVTTRALEMAIEFQVQNRQAVRAEIVSLEDEIPGANGLRGGDAELFQAMMEQRARDVGEGAELLDELEESRRREATILERTRILKEFRTNELERISGIKTDVVQNAIREELGTGPVAHGFDIFQSFGGFALRNVLSGRDHFGDPQSIGRRVVGGVLVAVSIVPAGRAAGKFSQGLFGSTVRIGGIAGRNTPLSRELFKQLFRKGSARFAAAREGTLELQSLARRIIPGPFKRQIRNLIALPRELRAAAETAQARTQFAAVQATATALSNPRLQFLSGFGTGFLESQGAQRPPTVLPFFELGSAFGIFLGPDLARDLE